MEGERERERWGGGCGGKESMKGWIHDSYSLSVHLPHPFYLNNLAVHCKLV